MKILIDVNLAPRWVEALASEGFEAVHWTSVGDATARDEELASYARAHGYILFTHDLDFGAILAQTRADGPSVIQVRTHDVLPEAIAGLVVAALTQHAAALTSGALVTVNAQTSRVRVLPIR